MGLGAIAPLLTRDTATGRVKAVNGLLEWLIALKDVDEVLRDAATQTPVMTFGTASTRASQVKVNFTFTSKYGHCTDALAKR